MADKRVRKRKGKNEGREISTLMVLGGVLVVYTLLTLICTYLYNYLPLPNVGGIWGRDSFYESFIQGMYSSLADFFVFTVVLSSLMKRWERKNMLRKYHEEIEACRFWFEPQAAFRLRSLILNLQKENVFEVDLTKCYLEKIKLKKIRLENSELMGAWINESNLEHSEFVECNFRGVYLENAILRSCKFDRCILEYLKCKGSNLKSIEMYNCVLSGSDFTDADMGAAIMKCCNLKNVKFENCNLERANLLGCTEINIHELVKSKSLKHIKVEETIKSQIKNIYPEVQLD